MSEDKILDSVSGPTNSSTGPQPIPYDRDSHFEQVLHWMQLRGETLVPEALPATGFIVPGVAAGFLYRTDSSIAWIDGLVASKDVPKETRSKALDEIVQALRAEARNSGFKVMMGLTQFQPVVDRALRLGFQRSPKTFQLVVVIP